MAGSVAAARCRHSCFQLAAATFLSRCLLWSAVSVGVSLGEASTWGLNEAGTFLRIDTADDGGFRSLVPLLGFGLLTNATVKIVIQVPNRIPFAVVVLMSRRQIANLDVDLPRAKGWIPELVFQPGRVYPDSAIKSTWRSHLLGRASNSVWGAGVPFIGISARVHVVTSRPDYYYLVLWQRHYGALQGMQGFVLVENPGMHSNLLPEQRGRTSTFLVIALAHSCCFFVFLVQLVRVRHCRFWNVLHGLILVVFFLTALQNISFYIRLRQIAATGFEKRWQVEATVFISAVREPFEILLFYLTGAGYKVVRSQVHPAELALVLFAIVVHRFGMGWAPASYNAIFLCLKPSLDLYVIAMTNYNSYRCYKMLHEIDAGPELGSMYFKYQMLRRSRIAYVVYVGLQPVLRLYGDFSTYKLLITDWCLFCMHAIVGSIAQPWDIHNSFRGVELALVDARGDTDAGTMQ